MKIPIKYNLRSLWVRRIGTLMTALGIGLTVTVVVIMLALVNGLDSAFVQTGRDDQLLVIRQGSFTEVNSYFNRNLYPTVRDLPGIARDESGDPMASGEIVVVVSWPRKDGEPSNLVMRGIGPKGFALRPELSFVEGRKFQDGLREIAVSRSIASRFQGLQLGETVTIADGPWKIVGIFEASGGAYESEVLTSYDDVAQEWSRAGIFSSILIRTESPQATRDIQARVKDDQRVNLQALSQKKYFGDQTDASQSIRFLGRFVGLMMGIGACFAAMNMMYGTIMARVKEVATLRALGFRRRSVMGSFMIEAIALCLLGGLLGCLMALPIHGMTTGTTNLSSTGNFSEMLFQFRITPAILLTGLVFSLTVGILGGFFPSLQAARTRLIDALR